MTEWRLEAYRHWLTMPKPDWAKLNIEPIDYQAISYYAAPKAGEASFDEYISDPAKPVTFRTRPVQPVGYGDGFTWRSARYRSNGGTSGVKSSRCEKTTWKISPAAMYSLQRSTLRR